MSDLNDNTDALANARQVLKDISEWQKHVTNDLENEKRNERTADLYTVVDAIGQNEGRVESARIRQLVREHIIEAEADVKKMVMEQLQLSIKPSTTSINDPPKKAKFFSRLPRVALLPPKGRQLNDKSRQTTNTEASERTTPRKRPSPKPRPKTLSELMERNTKPLPESVLEEFGLPRNRAGISRKQNSVLEERQFHFAVPVAPPVRMRPNEGFPDSSAPLEQCNVALINIGPKELDSSKLKLQVLPSVNIKSRTRSSRSQENFKLINVIDSEDINKKNDCVEDGELPGNEYVASRPSEPRNTSKNGSNFEYGKQGNAAHFSPVVKADELKIKHVPPHFTRERIAVDNFVYRPNQPMVRTPLLSGDQSAVSLEGLASNKSIQFGNTDQLPNAAPQRGDTNDLLRNVISGWTEQDLIKRVVEEILRNIATIRPDVPSQTVEPFPSIELIQQLVLEVVQEDFLKQVSLLNSRKQIETKNLKDNVPDDVADSLSKPSETKISHGHADDTTKPELKAPSLQHDAIIASTENVLDERTEQAQSQKCVDNSTNDIDIVGKNDVSSRTANSNIVGFKPEIEHSSEPIEQSRSYRDAEVNTVFDGKAKDSIPRDIAVHVVIEDKRGSKKEPVDLAVKRTSDESVKPTQPADQASSVPKNSEAEPKTSFASVPTMVDAATESDTSHLRATLNHQKVVKDVAVNVALQTLKDVMSVGTQVETRVLDLPALFSPESVETESDRFSPVKSPVSSSGDEQVVKGNRSVRDVAVQLSSHTSSSVTTGTDNTTLTTTTSSEEPISEGELIYKMHRGAARSQIASLESTLQSIDEGEVVSDGEIPVAVRYPLQQELSVGEIHEEHGVSPPLMEPKTKAGRRDDRSRLKLTSSFSEGEMILHKRSSSSEESPSSGASPDVLASPDIHA